LTPTPPIKRREGEVRIGITASRKIGNAVARNRAKRRLRAAAREALPLSGRPGHDYVLVARAGILTRDFQALLGDVTAAMAAAHAKLDARPGGEK
jgi:ribonuclease P protein component